jgi:hypothetical protein
MARVRGLKQKSRSWQNEAGSGDALYQIRYYFECSADCDLGLIDVSSSAKGSLATLIFDDIFNSLAWRPC